MSKLRRNAKTWLDKPATGKTVGGVFGLTAVATAVIVLAAAQWVGDQFATERRDRSAQSQEGAKRDRRIERRVEQLDRRVTPLCRRVAACRAVLLADRRQARREQSRREPSERRDRRQHDDDRAPEQVADRPPRAPVSPAPPDLDGSDGDDDPPDSGTPTPQTPSPAPERGSSIVEVDVPPVDLDGDQGLLPQLLPEVNLPPVDLAPIRVP